MHFTPTDEQAHALELFGTGAGLAIEAGAGTGKTSTLTLLARSTNRGGQYVAFNKAIVTDAAAKMPGTVAASTAHSLAYRAVGKDYARRLRGGRMRSDQIARHLGVDPFVVSYGTERKVLQPGYMGSLVMRAVGRFCQTTDEAPNRSHVPYIDGIDLPRPDGRRTYTNNDEVAAILEPHLRRAWADLCRTEGRLPFRHDHYLKLWALSHPRINADFILFDEAQDANPVLVGVMAEQTHAQLVFVGDSNQAIYEFTGAVNALATVPADQRAYLSQSFRFGPAVAEVANRMLDKLDAELRLRGTDAVASVVDAVADPDAVLCRTNATAVERVLAVQAEGRKVHLVGGGAEVVDFAKAAQDLMDRGHTNHPELACFRSWNEVDDYVRSDPQGSELRLMANLVNDYTVPTILGALERMIPESAAEVIVSTAHKAKGREWDSVQIAGDFPTGKAKDGTPQPIAPSEYRLMYVAATRARRELDLTACPVLAGAPVIEALPPVMADR